MPDPAATTPPAVDPDYLKVVLTDAAAAYIAENAGPFTAEAEAYVKGFVHAQMTALAEHNMKVISSSP